MVEAKVDERGAAGGRMLALYPFTRWEQNGLFAYGMAVRSSLEGDKYNFLYEWCDVSSLLCMGLITATSTCDHSSRGAAVCHGIGLGVAQRRRLAKRLVN